jgi:transketolase
MNFSDEIRKIIIAKSKLAGVGHIGSGLSIADLVGVTYQDILRIKNPNDPERDRFVLSKGHAVLALYAALFLKGFLSEEELNKFSQNNSRTGIHPKHFLPGVEFTTGSLGQGITFAVGAALSAKIQKSDRKIFCLISDAELNEGSFWEAILFAAQQKLTNLVIMLDLNGQQALGYTDDVIKISNIAKKMQDFDFFVEEIDGHDQQKIRFVLENFTQQKAAQPTFIVAHTISGKGVSFMEKSIPWHYKSMNEEEYQQASLEVKIA